LLSGFFGGLSGNQGALRSAFLIKIGLSKEAFIGTGTVSAVIVDVSRLLVYCIDFDGIGEIWGLVFVATLTAFWGAFIGERLIKKITFRTLQLVVGIMLMSVGLAWRRESLKTSPLYNRKRAGQLNERPLTSMYMPFARQRKCLSIGTIRVIEKA
jgi:uncharacterized membrane protein YfcA